MPKTQFCMALELYIFGGDEIWGNLGISGSTAGKVSQALELHTLFLKCSQTPSSHIAEFSWETNQNWLVYR